jgi:hypothetical protein
MKLKSALSVAVLLSACVARTPADEDKKADAKSSAFESFKQLAGEWTGKGEFGEMRIVYKVTSGGTAVVETIDPGGDHEMITMIYPDGESLALTHYCMLGNQPHMKAKAKAVDNKVAFEFVNCSNLKSDKDMHMHNVTFTFVDKNTLKAEWSHYQDGKESGKAVFELTRKK